MGTIFRISHTSHVHFATKPVSFHARNAKDRAKIEQFSMRSFLETKVPSLFSEFRQAWWLPGWVRALFSENNDNSNHQRPSSNNLLCRRQLHESRRCDLQKVG